MSTVLVIEDNMDNMLLISDILEANGYTVLQAETGMQGVAMAEEHMPDFIILDIQLPDIIGNEVLAIIRSKEKIRTIPVVAMTSYAMAGDRERLLAAGCDGYVEKPIDPGRVMKQLQEVVKGKI
nr:response regulator [uncultured Desulfobacter sp.]